MEHARKTDKTGAISPFTGIEQPVIQSNRITGYFMRYKIICVVELEDNPTKMKDIVKLGRISLKDKSEWWTIAIA